MRIPAALAVTLAALLRAVPAHAQAPAAQAPVAQALPDARPEGSAHFGERTPKLGIGDALPVANPAARLKVGIADVPPWTIPPSKDVPFWSGLASQVWKQVATDLAIDYEVQQLEVEDLVAALADGKIDVAVTGLAIMPENLARFTMTPPFDQSGISIATRAQNQLTVRSVLARLAHPEVAVWMGVIFGFALLFAFLFWLSERRRNPPIEGRPIDGLRESFWWSVVTLSTVGYGDRVPVTRPGRIVAMAWMTVGFVLFTVSSAVVTSALTVASLKPVVTGPAGLARARVGVVVGSTGEGYVERAAIAAERFDRFEEAMTALADERLDAVVGATTTLVYLAERSANKHVLVLPRPLERNFVGLGMRFGLDPGLEKRIDLKVLEAAQGDLYKAMRATMMGEVDTADEAPAGKAG
jgi:ABC-type amino acid transport substrate-binding protein